MHKKRKEEGLMTKLAKVTTLPKVVNLGWSRDKGQSKDNASISDKDLYAFFFYATNTSCTEVRFQWVHFKRFFCYLNVLLLFFYFLIN